MHALWKFGSLEVSNEIPWLNLISVFVPLQEAKDDEKENNPQLANNTNSEPTLESSEEDNNGVKIEISDSDDNDADDKSGGDAASKKRTDKRKLSEASDLILEGDRPPKKAQRKSHEDAQCNGDDVMVISDDEEDANKKKDVVNGNKDDKPNESKESNCDVKKDNSEQDTANTEVKDVKEEGDSNTKSIVARSNLKQQQLSIDCNVIEKLDGGEMISNGVYGSSPDSPNTQKLKSEALANVRGAKVSLHSMQSTRIQIPLLGFYIFTDSCHRSKNIFHFCIH